MSQIARFLEGIFSLLFLSIDIACFSVWINVVEHVDFGGGSAIDGGSQCLLGFILFIHFGSRKRFCIVSRSRNCF